ncbi:hypothetical protein GW17_00044478 [Ensete ventricosum]|nr:hypothetical protein GW17_00044478 [Ensete ventricosum]RZR88686.1 hypothetical protein BHM03_00016330 [Ensete ventricosum]
MTHALAGHANLQATKVEESFKQQLVNVLTNNLMNGKGERHAFIDYFLGRLGLNPAGVLSETGDPKGQTGGDGLSGYRSHAPLLETLVNQLIKWGNVVSNLSSGMVIALWESCGSHLRSGSATSATMVTEGIGKIARNMLGDCRRKIMSLVVGNVEGCQITGVRS